ncbi:hypothetical protein SELMODRAFT_407843 [Selaginella moellendorffii]|uniref:Peptide deformylase n=1 Tax=Selaginella moellendorffii TaxID=88036 RepID=D8R4Y2_SELML|nr:hypothetical protein SELMODRAFT_407843 [Selaginella moellendorffii]
MKNGVIRLYSFSISDWTPSEKTGSPPIPEPMSTPTLCLSTWSLGGIEAIDQPDSTLPIQELVVVRVHIVSKQRDESHSLLRIGLALWSRIGGRRRHGTAFLARPRSGDRSKARNFQGKAHALHEELTDLAASAGPVEFNSNLSIVLYADPKLRARNIRISSFDDKVKKLMLDVTYRRDGVGLSAPQVGVNARLMVFNPEGERGKGKEDRYRSELKAQDINGKKFGTAFRGWTAGIFRHEYDHLEVAVVFVRTGCPLHRPDDSKITELKWTRTFGTFA